MDEKCLSLLIILHIFVAGLHGTLAQYSTMATATGQNTTTSIRFVHVLWRHGDRTPTYMTFPTDHNKLWTWPEGWGELTKVGMRQAYHLGKFLRNRYIDTGFLSEDYNSSEIYVRSTSFNRTLMTAATVMAGMYPPIADNKWMEGMTWQPIPIHSIPRMYDPLLWPDRPCPKMNDIFEKEIMQSALVKRIWDENKDFLEFIQTAANLTFKTLFDIRFIYDPLNCEVLHNHTWPQWVTPQVFDKIINLFHQMTTFYSHDLRLQRLRGGLLVGEIATRFYNKAKNSPLTQPPSQRFYAYSAHDVTVIPQLEIFGSYDGILPPYASSIIYELHEKVPGKFTVEIFYIKDPLNPSPAKINVQGCGEVCDVDIFYTIAKNVTPNNWFEDCGLGFDDPS